MNTPDRRAQTDRLVQSLGLLDAVREQGSFAGAARELGIDPSAVSHRVRALEADLDQRLFDRTTRAVRPTRAGVILCDLARRTWEEAERALAAARDLRSSRSIRLSVHSSLAMKWLLPRLPEAERAGLDLSIDVREGLVRFEGGEVDAGFRFGTGPYSGVHATRLAGCRLQPVIGASHPLARSTGGDPLAEGRVTLLADAGAELYRTGTTWADYLALAGLPGEAARAFRRFGRADLMLQAAIAGLGVALGRSLLIEDDIRQGLLLPVGRPMPIKASYWLVTTPELAETAGMVALRHWLTDQIRQTLG